MELAGTALEYVASLRSGLPVQIDLGSGTYRYQGNNRSQTTGNYGAR